MLQLRGRNPIIANPFGTDGSSKDFLKRELKLGARENQQMALFKAMQKPEEWLKEKTGLVGALVDELAPQYEESVKSLLIMDIL
jgi:hypothetical protein